jgi:hypothetical protein
LVNVLMPEGRWVVARDPAPIEEAGLHTPQAVKVLLDANILFSAAYPRSAPSLARTKAFPRQSAKLRILPRPFPPAG